MSITFSKNSASVTLRNPQFPDTETKDLHVNLQRSMSGTFFTYVASPVNNKLTLQFNDLTDSEIVALEAFLDSHLGDVITYTDFNSVAHSGSIVNNPFYTVQQRQVTPLSSGCIVTGKQIGRAHV